MRRAVTFAGLAAMLVLGPFTHAARGQERPQKPVGGPAVPRTAPAEDKKVSPDEEARFPHRWSAAQAWQWYDAQPWPVGANFVPSTAVNQLEMWQAETFDPETIDRELGWAADWGMNTMRVFLHDLAWRQDPPGFLDRVEQYLAIADRHGIRSMLVLFDGVWDPDPRPGPQRDPVPGRHNPGWVQSPGRAILEDPARHDSLQPYVHAVLRRFRNDPRVLAWDLFNEPENANRHSYGQLGLKREMDEQLKAERAGQLLQKTFQWARQCQPTQPLTCGGWQGNYLTQTTPIQQLSLDNSDVITFHIYSGPDAVRIAIEGLLKLGRPVLCTEYMSRGTGCTFENVLPLLHQHRIGAIHWGLVSGRTQTNYPWSSWETPIEGEPELWHHDVLRQDGTPYLPRETRLIRQLATIPPTRPAHRPQVAAPPDRETLLAGMEAHRRAQLVKAGWIRDPYITPGPDGWFYLTGTTPLPDDLRQVSDPYNTGLGPLSLVGWKAQVWRSRNLVDWDSLGTPFTLQDGIWFQAQPAAFAALAKREWRLWAPELHWLGDRWALVHTSPAPVAGANLSLTTGAQVGPPWQNPLGTEIGRRHDPSLFREDDGTWWMVWGATSIAPLRKDLSGFNAQAVQIGPSGETAKMGHEGCLLRKIGDRYVLFGTGWSTGKMRRGSYNLYYATAANIAGPYSARRFVGRFLGHGTPFQDHQGRWWCTAFFNANVPPLPREDIQARDLSQNAQTINQQGVTLVPLEVNLDAAGEPAIRAIDPAYATPGPDELQSFAN